MKLTISELNRRYLNSRMSLTGDKVECPSCGKTFIKSHGKVFCSNNKTSKLLNCKDFYWNNVTPHKKNRGIKKLPTLPTPNLPPLFQNDYHTTFMNCCNMRSDFCNCGTE
jgi:hypothetical protein